MGFKKKKTFVKAGYAGKKNKKRIHDAVRDGTLDAYVKNPQTGEPIKLPKEIAKRIVNGESISWDYILNYKVMN